ncbi:MAG: hypothetical protein GX557_00080 [Chloroflexi bacterium]|nr:hypothetical protein [Chloroflexota bacterium]
MDALDSRKLVWLALGVCLAWATARVLTPPAPVLGQADPTLAATGTPSAAPPSATATPDGALTPTWTPDGTLTVTPDGTLTATPGGTLPPTPEGTIALPTIPPTPTPCAVQLPLVRRQLRSIHNGDFETGALTPGWGASGALPSAALRGVGRTGAWGARLGNPSYDNVYGCPVGHAAVAQTVDVPISGDTELGFSYRVFSYDTIDYDYFSVTITVVATGATETVWRDGRIDWSADLWDSGWLPGAIPLDDYRGRPVTITFRNTMTNPDGWFNTWTYLDDVTLTTTLP